MRWLLPEGIDELLPEQAQRMETNRRTVIDLFLARHYQLVVPPLVEFTDSLLTGSGVDLDRVTAKLTDPNSGKTMGIRADITPQTARIDAHSMKATAVNRLCYAATLLKMQTDFPNQNRTPMQIGIEHYGDPSLNADQEVVNILLEMLDKLGIQNILLDIGHCGILEELLRDQDISQNQHEQLITILQQKSNNDLNAWFQTCSLPKKRQRLIWQLMQLFGDNLLASDTLQQFLATANNGIIDSYIDQLKQLSSDLQRQFGNISLFFDLGEVRGFHYHTGIIFAAYHPNCGHMIANGGRYDNIGEAFGNARPATGFSADLKLLTTLGN